LLKYLATFFKDKRDSFYIIELIKKETLNIILYGSNNIQNSYLNLSKKTQRVAEKLKIDFEKLKEFKSNLISKGFSKFTQG
jgi:hypothetical protein